MKAKIPSSSEAFFTADYGHHDKLESESMLSMAAFNGSTLLLADTRYQVFSM